MTVNFEKPFLLFLFYIFNILQNQNILHASVSVCPFNHVKHQTSGLRINCAGLFCGILTACVITFTDLGKRTLTGATDIYIF